MKKTKIVLFLNNKPGIDILEYFLCRSDVDEINRIYFDDLNVENIFTKEIKRIAIENNIELCGTSKLKEDSNIQKLKEIQADVFILVYWPYLLKGDVFKLAKKTINFHPALLPINRGWFPHVHSIIDGSKTGVTLHEIDDDADTGKIWVQKEVKIESCEGVKEVYEKLQKEIVNLFKKNWVAIKDGLIIPFAQDNKIANYHKKKEIEALDIIDLEKKYSAKDFINLLRARSFGNKGFAYFYDENGEKIYLNLRLNKKTDF